MEGFGKHELLQVGWRSVDAENEEGHVVGVHTVPVEQFAHLIDSRGACLCGPIVDVEVCLDCGIPIAMVGHMALDPRFYDGWGFMEDWGPDGPVDHSPVLSGPKTRPSS